MTKKEWEDRYVELIPDTGCDKFAMHYHPNQDVCQHCQQKEQCEELTRAFHKHRDEWGWIDKQVLWKRAENGM